MKNIKEKKKYILAALLVMALIAGGIFTGMKTMNIADAKDTGSKVATEKKDTKEEDKAKAKDADAKKEDGKKEEDKEEADKAATSDSGNGGAATTNTATTTTAAANNSTAAAGGGNTYVAPAKQSSAPATSTQPAKTQPAKPHTHNWVPHYATKNVQKTYTNYRDEPYTACNDCNADITNNCYAHSEWETDRGNTGGWHVATRSVPYQDTATVQEQYVDYYYCSGCGATK